MMMMMMTYEMQSSVTFDGDVGRGSVRKNSTQILSCIRAYLLNSAPFSLFTLCFTPFILTDSYQ